MGLGTQTLTPQFIVAAKRTLFAYFNCFQRFF